MSSANETTDESQRVPQLSAGRVAGLLVIWTQDRPATQVLPLQGAELLLGRDRQERLFANDERVSRDHCRVEFDGTTWLVQDLGSKNGTFVNGTRLEASRSSSAAPLLRLGRTLLWAVDDLRPYETGVLLQSEGLVLGGLLQRAWSEIELAAHAGSTLCLRGESGSGKELAARAFHQATGKKGSSEPFVGVNCAAIPEGLAERLLFGARRGAYSGATGDVQGYLQAADGGTLFLDEIAELDPRVQAKLLRVLETKEVLPLGATRPERVEFRICAAAHADLRDQVQSGKFREDLYYRIGRPEVRIAALRERIDELPWLVQAEVARAEPELSASVRLIEACALRPWPGNVRELLGEARRAAYRALRAQRKRVECEDLDQEAGARLSERAAPENAELPAPPSLPDDAVIRGALAEHGGNVTRAARALGLHRNQLRRWLGKNPSSPPQEQEDEP
jgi:transcriptional regulator of acetoin/glycerol metabolism